MRIQGMVIVSFLAMVVAGMAHDTVFFYICVAALAISFSMMVWQMIVFIFSR